MNAERDAAASLRRIDEREGEIRAWAHLDRTRIMREARALDQVPARGALHGVAVGVKDIILTADMPTRYNTNLPYGAPEGVDAACVALLRAAGALIFGKTETVEFGAIGRAAHTRNPHDLGRTPGGSSSGSAAAVADGHVRLALGTQTAGSIIRPASFCGVYGFKPSWGLVCSEGAKVFAPSLDTIGWFARGPGDLSLVLDVLAPAPDYEAAAPFRVAVCQTPLWDRAGEDTRKAMAHAARLFDQAGAEIVTLQLPAVFAGLAEAQSMIMRAEGGRTFLSMLRVHGDALHPKLRGMVEDLRILDIARLIRAYDLAASCRVLFDEIAAAFTAVLVPSTVGEAPAIASGTGDYVFNGLWTLLHAPCANLPLYSSEAGLPVGVTLTGKRFSDREVLWAAGRVGWDVPSPLKPRRQGPRLKQ